MIDVLKFSQLQFIVFIDENLSSSSFIFNIKNNDNNIFFFDENKKAALEAKKICILSILKENYELGMMVTHLA